MGYPQHSPTGTLEFATDVSKLRIGLPAQTVRLAVNDHLKWLGVGTVTEPSLPSLLGANSIIVVLEPSFWIRQFTTLASFVTFFGGDVMFSSSCKLLIDHWANNLQTFKYFYFRVATSRHISSNYHTMTSFKIILIHIINNKTYNHHLYI